MTERKEIVDYRNNPHVEEDMKLPVGRTCIHCTSWAVWCHPAIGIHALNEVCDYSPSRFAEFKEV